MHISCLSGQSPHLNNLRSTSAVPTTRSLQKALCAPSVDLKTPLFLNFTYELDEVRPQVNIERSFQRRYRFYMSFFHNLRHVVMPDSSNDAVNRPNALRKESAAIRAVLVKSQDEQAGFPVNSAGWKSYCACLWLQSTE
jgi:hypothetical protein